MHGRISVLITVAILACSALTAHASAPSRAVAPTEQWLSATDAYATLSTEVADSDALAKDLETASREMDVPLLNVWAIQAFIDANRDLETRLSREYPNQFGGLYVEYLSPRVVVRWAGSAATAPESLRTNDLIAIETTAISEADLTLFQHLVNREFDAHKIDTANWTDIRTSSLHIDAMSDDQQLIERVVGQVTTQSGVPAQVAITYLDSLSEPLATIYAGHKTTNCTAGFTIKHVPTGSRQATTSGHCPNVQSFNDVSATFLTERYGGSFDLQQHSVSSAHTLSALMKTGSQLRAVNSSTSRAATVRGQTYCKYG